MAAIMPGSHHEHHGWVWMAKPNYPPDGRQEANNSPTMTTGLDY